MFKTAAVLPANLTQIFPWPQFYLPIFQRLDCVENMSYQTL